MPAIDIVDSTWICGRPAAVAMAISDPSNWPLWWPDLDLAANELRGDKGVRWTVRRTDRGWAGSMEVWLQPVLDGVVAHYFLRLDPPSGTRMRPGRLARETDRHRRRAKQVFWALADRVDPGRIARISTPPGM